MYNSAQEQWLILLSTPLYLVFILLEVLLSNAGHRNWYSWKDTLHNFYLMLLNSSIDLAFRGVYVAILAAVWHFRIFEISVPWLYWILLFIFLDFMYYWLHRLEHEVRLFWAVHVTHHSSEKFNLTVGFRSSVFQPLYRFLFFLPLALVGFKALDIIFVFSASQIWGILVHTHWNIKLGWLEKIFVTPSHHRVHHASNPLYLDKNLGMFLIIWDKWFGTFQAELPEHKYQPIRFGLTKPQPLEAPFELLVHEWNQMLQDLKKDIPWSQKIQYIVGPPGWSHDGSRLTSQQMCKQEQLASLQPQGEAALPSAALTHTV